MSDKTAPAADSVGSTSASLVERVRRHDQAAWRRMVRLYGPLVYYWCRHCELQASDLADVFQEVFRSVAGSIGAFEHGDSGQTFRGWLRTITRNKLNDHFRKAKRVPLAAGGSSANARWQQFVDQPQSSTPSALDEERTVLVHRALGLLKTDFEERTWKAFWRTAVDGQSATQVADELGMTPAAVRKSKSRVLQRLREELDDDA
jgi:RNA polymerase sigma-70 factor (ECF subfamily)